jgi:hypothetical protein
MMSANEHRVAEYIVKIACRSVYSIEEVNEKKKRESISVLTRAIAYTREMHENVQLDIFP